MGYSNQFKAVCCSLVLASMLLFMTGCTSSPSQLKDWYSENYPQARSVARNEQTKRSVATDEGSSRLPKIIKPESVEPASGSSEHNSAPLTLYDNTGKTTGLLKMTQGSLDEPVDLNFATAKPKLSEYNISSLIEGKLLKLVEDAYVRRDENEFTRLYHFFLDSFPQSTRRSYLEEKWRTFFYSEDLDITPLKGSLVEVTYPGARDMNEFNHYLAKLKSNGVKTIQLDMTQVLEQPIYLFAKQENPLGYYFKTPTGPLVNDLLEKITALAHDNGLKVLISFPMRNHPMLGHQSVLLVDESWNAIRNETVPNSKLDLLNPAAHAYLSGLIQALLSSNIDGIVFKDDFTYDVYEGFSTVARKRYLKATGRTITFSHLFVPADADSTGHFDILADEAFNDIAVWRTREIKQLLWDLIAEIRKEKKTLILGIEVTPEMVLQEDLSVKWYSTGLSYLRDLNLDLFILKWRKTGSDAESDFDSYRKSAWALRSEILRKTAIYTKVPLSSETNNIINLNRRIRENVKVQQDMEMAKMAIGPVSRLKKQGFLYGSRK